jgi:hypothetical protein
MKTVVYSYHTFEKPYFENLDTVEIKMHFLEDHSNDILQDDTIARLTTF